MSHVHGFPDFHLPDPISEAPTPASCGTDMLSAGAAWLRGQLRANASQPIIYSRGDEDVAICATLGRTLLKLADEVGAVRLEWTDRDFIISAEDLVFSGSTVLPRRGDTIRVSDGTVTETFEVLPYDDEPPWKWSDPFRQQIRIHTKRISTEPA